MRQLNPSAAAQICRGIFSGYNLSDILFCLEPGCHHLVAALDTPQAEIRSGTQHKPVFAPTGVGLLHNQGIANFYIHTHFPFMASQ
jgi:hypothetical protein